MKCETKKISTVGEEIAEILQNFPAPIGIIIFGADGEFNNEVIKAVSKSLGHINFCLFSGGVPCVFYLQRDFKNAYVVVVAMTPEESVLHTMRHNLVNTMREAGAESVIGIYAQTKKSRPLVELMEANPPTADGLERLIAIPE